ncbi:hypothetical protein BOX15_Mlig017176g2, partial [Macrostomum lignano]
LLHRRTIKRWFSSGEGASLVVMETRHLEAGDPEPPELPRGSEVLTLYSMLYCPYAQRTRLVLQHKQLPHRIINVNLVRKPDWFLARAPLPSAKVPIIELPGDEKLRLADSLITCEFLEEAFAAATSNGTDGDLMPSMGTPDAPRLRAAQRQTISRNDAMISAFYRWALKKDEPAEERELLWDRLLWQLRNLQADLRDGGFFGGARPQLADFMVWPWIERLPPLMQHYCLPPRLPDSLGHLSTWSEAMSETEPVRATRLPDWAHLAFVESHWRREPRYDFLENR